MTHFLKSLSFLILGLILQQTLIRIISIGSIKPDVILVIPCGFDRAAARLAAQRHDALLRSFGATVHCLDASAYFSRSGPRVVDGVELLSEIL